MFAHEKLAQEPSSLAEIREQYCQYYLNMLTDHEVAMTGAGMESTRQVVRQELYHLQKATQWAITDWDQEALRRILTTTLVLYAVYAWYEGVDALRLLGDLKVKALTRDNDPDPERHPIVLLCRAYQGYLLTNLGQIEESEKISQSCFLPLKELGYLAEYSVCLHNLGVNASFRGDYEIGTDLLEQAVRIGRDSDFILWPTYLLWLGHGYLMLGEYEAGLASLQKSREIFMRNETLWGAAFAISKMGLAYDGMGDHLKALEYYQEALIIFEKMGNIAGKGYSLSRMSMSACFTGNHQLAIHFGEEAYQHFEDIGHSWGLASTLPRLGFAHLALGEVKEAHALFLRGVKLSQEFDMAPLSLYALAGIACTMLQKGNQKAAIDLLSYVVVHPKSPLTFLDQPLGLLNPLVKQAIKVKSRELRAIGELETINEIIERYQIESL
jgi:tetratricopeptide (TPR) repeat protein